MKTYTLKFLADYLHLPYRGDANYEVSYLTDLRESNERSLSFFNDPKLRSYLKAGKVGIVILREQDSGELSNVILTENPYLAYARASILFDQAPRIQGIASTAVIAEGVKLGKNVALGHHVVLEEGVVLGDNVIIEAGSVLQKGVVVGDDSHLYSNVSVYYGVKIGKRVIIHSGTVIGSDGFGNANNQGKWEKIYQIGSVEIGDEVEIGSNTSIDRGALGNTIIESGVKIDNLVQIAHNVKIGEHTAIAGCVGIAGSAEIGKYCLIGGGSGIAGHLKIQDGIILTAMTAVSKSLTTPGVYSSIFPAYPRRRWWKLVAIFSRLEKFIPKFKITPIPWWKRYLYKFLGGKNGS